MQHINGGDWPDPESGQSFRIPIPDMVHRTRVEQYSATAQTVSGIATFAGAITLSTQLLIQCPNSRLQALLALTSQLFLATPLVLLGVAAVLHGRAGNEPVDWDSPLRAFIVAQFMVSGVMVIASFLVLGFAMYVADAHHPQIGNWGLAMIGLIMLVILIALFVSNSTNRFWGSIRYRASMPRKTMRWTVDHVQEEYIDNHGFYDIVYLRVFLATFVPQVVVVACLVVFGARTAATAQIQFGFVSGNSRNLEAVASQAPEAGYTYIIQSASGGRWITLLNGQVVLEQPHSLGSPFWTCEEHNGNLGFRNAASNRYLGHNGEAVGGMICLAKTHSLFERIQVRPDRGGCTLHAEYWFGFRPIGLRVDGDGVERLSRLTEAGARGLTFTFLRVQL
ncbi:hypothetical protein DV737_g4566, partial [Chaetothyriales sp. CBS 132003]